MHARGFLCLSVVYAIASSYSSFRIGCKADGGPKLFTIHQLKCGPFWSNITCIGRYRPDLAFWHGKLFSAKQLYMILEKLQSYQARLRHHWYASETPLKWRFAVGTMMARIGPILVIFVLLINYIQKENWTPSEKKLSWSAHGIYNLQAQTRRHRP